MSDWFSLTAIATTIALGGADHAEPISEIELRTGHHATLQKCAVDAVPFERPTHVDPLTRPGSRVQCIERRRLNGECLHVQVSVVRDHDGSFLVDIETEPDLGPAPDAVQQYRARTVRGLAERGAILARWPAGAWHDMRACADEDKVQRRRIDVPARCQLLLDEYAGKPHYARIERAGAHACLVAVNQSARAMNVFAWLPPPADESADRDFRHGENVAFPVCIPPGAVTRTPYLLVGEGAKAWHVEHYLTADLRLHAGQGEDLCKGTSHSDSTPSPPS